MDREQAAGLNRTPARWHAGRRRVVVVRLRPHNQRRPRLVLSGASPEADAKWFAEQMTRKYSNLASAEKRQILTALREALPPQPRRGRPRRADVTEALRLEADGVPRKEIYRLLNKNTRDQQHALREAMRQRKARKRRRDKSGTVTPT